MYTRPHTLINQSGGERKIILFVFEGLFHVRWYSREIFEHLGSPWVGGLIMWLSIVWDLSIINQHKKRWSFLPCKMPSHFSALLALVLLWRGWEKAVKIFLLSCGYGDSITASYVLGNQSLHHWTSRLQPKKWKVFVKSQGRPGNTHVYLNINNHFRQWAHKRHLEHWPITLSNLFFLLHSPMLPQRAQSVLTRGKRYGDLYLGQHEPDAKVYSSTNTTYKLGVSYISSRCWDSCKQEFLPLQWEILDETGNWSHK